MPTADAEGWSWWPAPAKLNLFLRIVGRRADGYHDLQSVFQLLDWGDEVGVRCTDSTDILRHGGAAGVAPEDDLVVRAARALRDATGVRAGAEIDLVKRIPVGGGFGGGSSDAATVLLALDRLWATGLNFDELAGIGLELGADVPVFVRGRSAWAEGVGERLTPLQLGPRWYLVLDSGVSVPTRDLFAAPELTRDAPSATIADFVSGKVRGNAFEPVLRRRAPKVAQALDELAEHGDARLTGTGGGMFVAFDTQAAAEAARASLAARWRCWIAAGVDESPLHRVLRRAHA